MHCLFKGTPLGDWSPSSSVQHHMIPDSDGDAQERVYHLTFFHILYSLLPSPPTCRRWAGITLQLNLSTGKPCVLCVLEGSLSNPGAISPMQPTRPFGTESFPGPSQLHSTHGIWEVSGFCPPSQKPPWGICFSREKSCHWPRSEPVELGLMARVVGTNTRGTHGWMSELTFQSAISLAAPASSPSFLSMLREKKLGLKTQFSVSSL